MTDVAPCSEAGRPRRFGGRLGFARLCAPALCCVLSTVALGQPRQVEPQELPAHAIAMHGAPALPPGFSHFPYVNPEAPKGGQLRLGALGSFDSLNPFIIKGVAPNGLREYVFESLMARSADEPFTLYGLIAETIEVPADRSQITFHLRPEARFSDGRPITSADVAFSHKMLKEKGWPYHRSYYGKVARLETPDPRTARFVFEAGSDREMPLIIGLMPILPSHRLDAESFERTTLDPPVGSGPYVVARVDPGRTLVYRRNPDYWGKHLATHRGRFNFDEIRYDFFRDASTLFEAFKAGEIDVRAEDDPARWAEGYSFPAVADGRVVQREFKTGLPAGMSALVFNTRRPPFDEQNVRRALIHAFDAEWINRTLFHGLYRRSESFFSRSELASTGHPADPRERELLAPFAGSVREEVLEGRYRLPVTDGTGNDRTGLREAHRLLAQSGYVLKNGQLVAASTGRPLAVEFLAINRAQERLMLGYAELLRRIGINRPCASGRHRPVLDSHQVLRFRHDAMELGRIAVARQRADQPLVEPVGIDQRLAQLCGREEPCRRCDDRRPASGRGARGFRLRRSRARPGAALGRLRDPAVSRARPVDRLLAPPQNAGASPAYRHRLRYMVDGAVGAVGHNL